MSAKMSSNVRREQIALLRAFYADHDPSRLESKESIKAIDKIVDGRRGANPCMTPDQWEKLDQAMEEKYGWPIEPTGARRRDELRMQRLLERRRGKDIKLVEVGTHERL